MVRFVSEFGADSVPSRHPFFDDALAADAWPDLDWERLAEGERLRPRDVGTALRAQHVRFVRRLGRNATQFYQSHVLKVQIETLRTAQSTGRRVDSASPAWPTLRRSSRRACSTTSAWPKDAGEIVRAACAPLLVVAEPLPDWVNPGDRLAPRRASRQRPARTRSTSPVVDATASWAGGEQRWRFGGPIPADDVVKVGQIDLVVPDTLGELAIELEMTARPHHATNRYTTAVTIPRS